MKWFLIFLSIFLLSCSALRAEIVGMWLFDEGKGDVVKDISKKGHDGKIKDGYKWVDGKFGKAVYFDGTGYVEIPHNDDLSFDKAFTIMIWANIEKMASDYVEFPRKENEYTIAPHATGKGSEITIWVNVGGAWKGPIPALGSAPVAVFGEWHHYASTYEGKTCKMFQDGKEVGTQDIGGPVNKTTAVIRLSNGMAGRLMTGAIDEYIMANNAFTVDQINDYMKRGTQMVMEVGSKVKLAAKWGEIKIK